MKIINLFQCEACSSMYKEYSAAKKCESSPTPEIITGSEISIMVEGEEHNIKIKKIECVSTPGKIGHDWQYLFESEIQIGADSVSMDRFWHSEINRFVVIKNNNAKPLSHKIFSSPMKSSDIPDEVWNFNVDNSVRGRSL